MNARCRFLAVAALLLVAAETPRVIEDRAELDGTWVVTNAEQNGEAIPQALIAGQTLTFARETYQVRQNDQTIEEGTYTADASKMPRRLDLKINKGPEDVGKSQLGIYEIDGETLKLAFARPGSEKRPEIFRTQGNGAALFIMTLKRQDEE